MAVEVPADEVVKEPMALDLGASDVQASDYTSLMQFLQADIYTKEGLSATELQCSRSKKSFSAKYESSEPPRLLRQDRRGGPLSTFTKQVGRVDGLASQSSESPDQEGETNGLDACSCVQISSPDKLRSEVGNFLKKRKLRQHERPVDTRADNDHSTKTTRTVKPSKRFQTKIVQTGRKMFQKKVIEDRCSSKLAFSKQSSHTKVDHKEPEKKVGGDETAAEEEKPRRQSSRVRKPSVPIRAC
eukprot:SAG11_NODE_764_length_7290_cov_9.187596_4_plen_243_part_00